MVKIKNKAAKKITKKIVKKSTKASPAKVLAKKPIKQIEAPIYTKDNIGLTPDRLPLLILSAAEPFIALVRTKSIKLVKLDKFEAFTTTLEGKPHLQLRWEFTGSIGHSSRYSIGKIIPFFDIEKVKDLDALAESIVQSIANNQQKYIGV